MNGFRNHAEEIDEARNTWHAEIRQPLPRFAGIRDPKPDSDGHWIVWAVVFGALFWVIVLAAMLYPASVAEATGRTVQTDWVWCFENNGDCRE